MPMLYATRDRTSSGMVLRDLLTARSALLMASRIDAVAVPCGALQWVATMDSSSARLGAEAKALTASRRVALSPHRVGTERKWRLPRAALHSAPRSRVTARHCFIPATNELRLPRLFAVCSVLVELATVGQRLTDVKAHTQRHGRKHWLCCWTTRCRSLPAWRVLFRRGLGSSPPSCKGHSQPRHQGNHTCFTTSAHFSMSFCFTRGSPSTSAHFSVYFLAFYCQRTLTSNLSGLHVRTSECRPTARPLHMRLHPSPRGCRQRGEPSSTPVHPSLDQCNAREIRVVGKDLS